jgi:hypothetical protein
MTSSKQEFAGVVLLRSKFHTLDSQDYFYAQNPLLTLI